MGHVISTFALSWQFLCSSFPTIHNQATLTLKTSTGVMELGRHICCHFSLNRPGNTFPLNPGCRLRILLNTVLYVQTTSWLALQLPPFYPAVCSGYSLLLPTISWKTTLSIDVYASKISTILPLTPSPMPSLYLFSEYVLLWEEIQKVLGTSVFTRLPLMWKRKWRIQVDRLKNR